MGDGHALRQREMRLYVRGREISDGDRESGRPDHRYRDGILIAEVNAVHRRRAVIAAAMLVAAWRGCLFRGAREAAQQAARRQATEAEHQHEGNEMSHPDYYNAV